MNTHQKTKLDNISFDQLDTYNIRVLYNSKVLSAELCKECKASGKYEKPMMHVLVYLLVLVKGASQKMINNYVVMAEGSNGDEVPINCAVCKEQFVELATY